MPVIINQLDVVAESAPLAPAAGPNEMEPPSTMPRLLDLRRVLDHADGRAARVRAD